MLKRIVLCLLLIFVLSGCDKNTPNPNEIPNNNSTITKTETNSVREQLLKSDEFLGIAFLGYFDKSYEDLSTYLTTIEAEDFIKDIRKEQYIALDGDELYCIVTKSDTATITIHEWLLDEQEEFTFKKGKQLYQSNDGKPILLKGNLGDLFPNILVTIEQGNEKLEYHPSIDLMTGKVGQPFNGPALYDFSKYDKVIPPEPFDADTLLNTDIWEVSYITTNNQLLRAQFIFDDKGFMTMSYSLDNLSYTVHYQGTYGYPDPEMYPCNALYFNIQKTEDLSSYNCPDHMYTVLTFEQKPFDMFVYASYFAGDRLFANDETQDMVFGY